MPSSPTAESVSSSMTSDSNSTASTLLDQDQYCKLINGRNDRDSGISGIFPSTYITSYFSSPSASPPLPPTPTRALPRFQPKVPWSRRLRNRIVVFLFFCVARFRIFLIKWLRWRVGLVPRSISVKPKETVWLKVRGRKTQVQIHYPPSNTVRSHLPPVHINLHGSGFCIPQMEEDSEMCAYLARTLGCVVLDADYCKAPQHKLPEPVHDVLEVVRYVLRNPDKYDISRITIGGVSAGATTALLVAASGLLEKGTIKAVVAWYACASTQWTNNERVVPPTPKVKQEDGKEVDVFVPGFPLPPWMLDLFVECAIPEGADLCDLSISPISIPSDAYPPTTLIVGTLDPLYNDSLALYHHLTAPTLSTDSKHKPNVELHLVPNATHAFERAGLGADLSKGEMYLWAERMKEVWGVMERRLREVYD